MNIWRSLKHPNIVPVFGICRFEKEKPPYLISPWMKVRGKMLFSLRSRRIFTVPQYGNVRHYLEEFPQKADRLKLVRLLHTVNLGIQVAQLLGPPLDP